jgi:soluble lytic murein transglycosylase-like protein
MLYPDLRRRGGVIPRGVIREDERGTKAKSTAIQRRRAAPEAGKTMDRARVVWVVMIAALLLSGTREQPHRMAAAGSTLGTVPVAEFSASHVARFLESGNPALSSSEIKRISTSVIRYSTKYGLDPLLVTQILWVESGARPWVRSSQGAVGLMQVMPHIAQPLELSGSLAAIETNIEAGCWILADNIRRLGEEDGISAYFWGSEIRSVSYLQRVREARAAIRSASES